MPDMLFILSDSATGEVLHEETIPVDAAPDTIIIPSCWADATDPWFTQNQNQFVTDYIYIDEPHPQEKAKPFYQQLADQKRRKHWHSRQRRRLNK